MLNITSKFIYGINAMIDLAENHGTGLTQIKVIAKRKKIPQTFLVQIFNKLVKTGIVKSVRGVNGGYKLHNEPEQISVLSVFEVLEGKISFCDNIVKTNAAHAVFKEAENKIKKVLDISLKDMLENQNKISQQINYYI